MPGFDIDSYLRISLSDMLLVAISTLLLTAAGKVLFWDKVSAYLTSRRQIIWRLPGGRAIMSCLTA